MKRTILFALCLSAALQAQIRIERPPEQGFEKRIADYVNGLRIVDTHEHLLSEPDRIKMGEKADFAYLFSHYAKDDLVSASGAPNLMSVVFGHEFPIEDRWALFKPYYDAMRNTAYAKVPEIAARDLYGIDQINDATYKELSRNMHEASKEGLYKEVLVNRAGIDYVIRDGYVEVFREPWYLHVERFDNFIAVSSDSEIRQHLKDQGVPGETLDDYVLALRKAFQKGLDRKMIGVKSGLAYNRIIRYENVPRTRAETVFNALMSGRPQTTEEVKALQDFMMHRVLDLADEADIPVQIHTGLHAGNGNIITNSRPTHLANCFMEHPDVDFILFHGGYPYGGELATLAKNFPNVYIDMCWTHIISPSYSIRYLHEWLETVPANKIMAFGGDYGIVEAVYGHAVMARKIVAQALTEMAGSGYMTEAHAIETARRLLRDNALEVFHLDGHSRTPDNLEVLNKPGRLHDWWTVHRSKESLVKEYMVIGPFEPGTGLDQVLPPEKEIRFDRTYPGLGGDVGWRKVETGGSGYLNFFSLFSERGSGFPGMAYACMTIESPDKRTITMTLGSNDGAKMWVNGKVVYNEGGGRTAVADQEFLKVNLKKGVNRILVKVENIGANWGLYLRVVDPENVLKVALEE